MIASSLEFTAGGLSWWACVLGIFLTGAVLAYLLGGRLVPAPRNRLSKAQNGPFGPISLLAPITVVAVAEKLPYTGSAALPLLVVGVLAVFLCGVAIGAVSHAAFVPVLERQGDRP